uniref:Epidermal growth factor receptor substrate 15 n=1 Tax=Setaria digitata TaxID=48799 RepID=A0A915PSJ8_9BILA
MWWLILLCLICPFVMEQTTGRILNKTVPVPDNDKTLQQIVYRSGLQYTNSKLPSSETNWWVPVPGSAIKRSEKLQPGDSSNPVPGSTFRKTEKTLVVTTILSLTFLRLPYVTKHPANQCLFNVTYVAINMSQLQIINVSVTDTAYEPNEEDRFSDKCVLPIQALTMNISTATISQPHTYLYENLYKEMNIRGKDVVPAQEAAAFLKRSNLSVTTLGQIWELADYNRKGCLDKAGAFIAFKLVAASQQGQPISWNSLLLKLEPPSFASRSATPSIPNFDATSTNFTSFADNWAISATDQAKYESIFDSLNPVDDKVPGNKVRPVLLNSGLPSTSLARIWELADMDKDGKLDRIEMSVALHLVYCALQGEPVPSVLPPTLIHPTKRQLVQFSSSVPPTSMSQWSGSRQRTGSVMSLEGSEQLTSGSERMRSQSVQPTSIMTSSLFPPRPSLSPSTAWPVQSARFEASFQQADIDKDGFVSGADVRDILLATGIQQNTLALVWSLVDLKKNGMLNLEQFALIMHLIENHKRGKPIPFTLPPNLIPPSFRTIEAPSTSISSRYTVQSTVPTGNEELDALIREVEKLILDRREADQEIVQLEADMTVKNSEIKNLKIELSTLENTVAQLEKQKGEAEKRLEALDSQIEHLGRTVEQSKEKIKEEEKRLNDLHLQTTQNEENETSSEELIKVQRELQSLEEEKKTLSATLAQRNATVERTSLELTKLERKYANVEETAKRVEAENEKLNKASERLIQLIESNDIEALNKEKNELFEVLSETYPVVENQNMSLATAFQNDPFAAVTRPGIGFETDPFAGTSSFTTFDAFSGKDPFSSDISNTRSSPAIVTPSKAPPPRPAPPKSLKTPIESDSFPGIDPFESGPTATATTGDQFADFANFDAFAKP